MFLTHCAQSFSAWYLLRSAATMIYKSVKKLKSFDILIKSENQFPQEWKIHQVISGITHNWKGHLTLCVFNGTLMDMTYVIPQGKKLRTAGIKTFTFSKANMFVPEGVAIKLHRYFYFFEIRLSSVECEDATTGSFLFTFWGWNMFLERRFSRTLT